MTLLLTTPESGSCTREEAFNPNLIPDETRTYQPLTNEELVNMIYKTARDKSIEIVDEHLGMDLKGQRFFGVCDIRGKDFFRSKIQLMIGFCNSYNKSMSARFCIGGKVTVCSNRAFYAYTDELTGTYGMVARPHKNWLEEDVKGGLLSRIQESFDRLDEFVVAQETFYNRLSFINVNDNRAYASIVRAAQDGVINKTKMLTIADEWNRQSVEPKDAEFEWHNEFQDRNAFSLFNAFTQVGKEKFRSNPVQSNMQTIDLTTFFKKEFKLN
jgi:hypothetical protein